MSQKQINTAGRVGYFLLNLPNAFTIAIPTFLVLFGTNVLGIKIAIISGMMALVKVFDGFTDVVAGIIIDKTHHKTGKARPWVLWMAIPFALTYAAQFWVPASWGLGLKTALVIILYTLNVSIFGTISGIATRALLPRMTLNEQERNTVGGVCGAAGVTLTGFLMAAVFPLTGMLGFTGTFTLFGCCVLVLSVVGWALVRELPYEVIEAATKGHGERPTIGAMVKNLFSNKYALLQFCNVFFAQTAGSFIQGCGTYYAIYVLGSQSWYTQFMLAGSIGSVVGMILMMPLVKKINPKNLYTIGCLMAVIGFIIIRITGDNPMAVVVLFFFIIMGGQVFTNGLGGVLSAQAVDYGEWKNSVRGEGLISSTGNVGNKIGSAVGTALMGALLAASGFIEGGVEQTASAVQGIKLTYTVGTPVAYFVLGAFFFLTWGLQKKMPQIQKELIERRAAAKK